MRSDSQTNVNGLTHHLVARLLQYGQGTPRRHSAILLSSYALSLPSGA